MAKFRVRYTNLLVAGRDAKGNPTFEPHLDVEAADEAEAVKKFRDHCGLPESIELAVPIEVYPHPLTG